MPNRRWLRIIPVAFIMYTIAFVDRTNISLALPSMSRDLHMNPEQAGNAAGVFFWGYMLLQIPGGYLAQHWSAKRFVAILLVIWGVCASATGLVRTWHEFFAMRLLLGVAEGGVWPATLVLLAHWFPRAERARANAYWMLCLPVAVVFSSPVSGRFFSGALSRLARKSGEADLAGAAAGLALVVAGAGSGSAVFSGCGAAAALAVSALLRQRPGFPGTSASPLHRW